MKTALLAITLLATSTFANATPMTSTSLTSAGTLSESVSTVGGVVFDLIGLNGTRVTSQLAASSLYVGYFDTEQGLIGTQNGWDNTVWGALGGGIAEAAVRLTVSDGDTGVGDFDYNENNLFVNSMNFGNFSDVVTERTSADGLTVTSSSLGFLDSELNTGWFYNNDLSALSDLYDSIVASSSIQFLLDDVDPTDNYFDFTQGIDNSLIDIGSGPQVTPSIPEPSTLAIFALALFGLRMRLLKK
ncbi:PEP-CTERM sorting domain-containing protein [Colwellia sp. D2M02]|uniref:PEP-CTERM sorting domain-containing protein n=1 Tax=Colwellia sp. D2M02 TaxID=2841562 RepID=UPI001C08E037|nr:PEP-CTERM sorting domain-containing protein [Colwellia sp. D2M02]MBU2894081.1 PEP-CTERM sorting domain-containing protein [Colwellia sp. D2M02]